MVLQRALYFSFVLSKWTTPRPWWRPGLADKACVGRNGMGFSHALPCRGYRLAHVREPGLWWPGYGNGNAQQAGWISAAAGTSRATYRGDDRGTLGRFRTAGSRTPCQPHPRRRVRLRLHVWHEARRRRSENTVSCFDDALSPHPLNTRSQKKPRPPWLSTTDLVLSSTLCRLGERQNLERPDVATPRWFDPGDPQARLAI